VRNDTGVYEGGEISLYYDPMIAKLVTHAPTRAEAIAAQADALDAFAVEGIRHNISFLSALMQHKRFRTGRLSTAFIAEEFPDGFRQVAPDGEIACVLVTAAVAIDHKLGERKRKIAGQLTGRAVTRERRRAVRLGDREYTVEIADDGRATVKFGDGRRGSRLPAGGGLTLRYRAGGGSSGNRKGRAETAAVESAWKPGEPLWCGTIDGQTVAVQVRPILNGFLLTHRGVEVRAYVYTEREAAAARLMPAKKPSDSGKALRCPMPGLVVAIAVAVGQEVKVGETLAVVEAMKMENVLRAERDAVVKTIKAKPGDSLAVDAVIMEFA